MERSLYQQLSEYCDSDYYPYHMPGHKRNDFSGFDKEFYHRDITEINDFDDLSNPSGILKEAQENMAKACHSNKSYFLVNGSTVGILTAISAIVPVGGKVLIPRNAHKSTYHGVVLRQAMPVYVYPQINETFGFYEAVTLEDIQISISENEDISAVVIVSPTYEGRLADIEKIAAYLHEKNIPLIVDEAHGAHLSYAAGIEGYTKSAVDMGADVVVQSVHKTLPAPTQTAVLHINSKLVEPEKIERYLHIYQTSSPSYLLMAGIDNCVRIMQQRGDILLKSLRDRYYSLLKDLEGCKCIDYLQVEQGKQDIGKFVFSALRGGIGGPELSDILRSRYHLEFEMTTPAYCLAMFTVGDSPEGFDRLKEALLEIDKELEAGTSISKDIFGTVLSNQNRLKYVSEQKYPIYEAWDMDTKEIALGDSVDRCAGTMVALYPPGTPILVPGEVITKESISLIEEYIRLGLEVQGIGQDKLGKGLFIRVIEE